MSPISTPASALVRLDSFLRGGVWQFERFRDSGLRGSGFRVSGLRGLGFRVSGLRGLGYRGIGV